jgi:hypothetical protein
MRVRASAIATLGIVIACSTPLATVPSASPSPTVAASGTAFSIAAERDMIGFFADRGALIAWSSTDGPPPRRSRVHRADPPGGPWRTLYESDAWLVQQAVSSGRMALAEIRELASGVGAYSQKLVLIDLDSGASKLISEFSMSSATFRGGGGAPRRPNGSIALGSDAIAWTHLIEGPSGSITGELRVASLADASHSTRIGASTEWIAPVAVDARRLVYIVGGKIEDELHVRDLASGADRVVATGLVGDSSMPQAWMSSAAVSGDWAVWQEQARGGKQSPEPEGTLYALHLVTGERHTVGRGPGCSGFTAAARYVALQCGRDPRIYEAATLRPVVLTAPAPGVGVQASEDGLIWFDVTPTGRNVVVFRPRP